jgi:hypothetical protein
MPENCNPLLARMRQDLPYHIKAFGNPRNDTGMNEATRRVFINDVLCAVCHAFPGVTIAVDKYFEGSLGCGPVDYTFVYKCHKSFDIIVTEAEKDLLEQGLAQSVA